MNLRDWDIFGELAHLEASLARPGFGSADPQEPWAPLVDIFEENDSLVLRVDLPGVRREDIELKVDSEGLTLEGRRAGEEPAQAVRLERPAGRFRRSFRIGVPIDPGRARATYRGGVLEITIPRASPTEPARLRVEVE